MIEVTEANIDLYTAEDVILPIIGHKVKMPSNPEMRQIIETIMKEDNMSMDEFNKHASLVTTCAAGSYRKMLAKADDVVFDIVEVTDSSQDLLTPNYL
jgi:tRNA(Glu) U13 pseudouridine synthase TruD